MTKEQQRKWCRDTLEKWRGRMFLGEWIFWFAHTAENPDEQFTGRPAAECKADAVYMQATITIHPCFWNSNEEDREHMLIHEMAHCHTESAWRIARGMNDGFIFPAHVIRDTIETLTQRIANIVYTQEWDKQRKANAKGKRKTKRAKPNRRRDHRGKHR